MSIFNVETMTASEAATFLGCWYTNVHQLIQRGTLPAKRFGRSYVIAKSDVERYAADRERERGIFAA